MAGLAAGPLYGVGAPWLKRLLPWVHPKEILDTDSGRMVYDKDAPVADSSLPGCGAPWTFWRRAPSSARPTREQQAAPRESV